MKMICRCLMLFIFIARSGQAFTQKIETDIFDNLTYESMDGHYESLLQRNIFDALVYSDNMDNEVILTRKYIDLVYGDLLKNKESELDIFRSMILTYRLERKYNATYSVDLFNKIIIEDNRNRKIEIGMDIFGNETYNEEVNNKHSSIKRNFNGALEYKSEDEEATLQKDIFNYWVYKDSNGNEFRFSSNTWRKLKNRLETEENIFHHLIYEFL